MTDIGTDGDTDIQYISHSDISLPEKKMSGLERVICIDGHIPGETICVDADDHANLNGPNGAGKTSLLRLIPVFYGSNPSEVVPRRGVGEVFVQYYLPRKTSMIIYEYRTSRGLMCAVLFRHVSGKKTAYRFLAEGYCPDHFSEMRDGENSYVQGGDLGRLWKANNLEHSRQIEDVIDFRGVIQGASALINRGGGKDLRSLASQFSLPQSIGKIRQIDKIGAAVLGRTGDMERVKGLLADIMDENNVKVPNISLQPDVKNHIVSLDILRELNGKQAFFNDLIGKGTSYQENSRAIGLAHTGLATIKTTLTDRVKTQKVEVDALRVKRRELREKIGTDREDLEEESSVAERARVRADGELNLLTDAFTRWEDEDISAKKVEYKQLGRFKELHEVAQKRVEQLDGDVKDIVREYEKACGREKDQHHKSIAQLRKKVSEREIDIANIETKRLERINEVQEELSREQDSIRDSCTPELEKLSDDIAKAKQESQHSFITAKEGTDVDLAEAKVTEIKRLKSDASSNLKSADSELKVLRDHQRECNTRLSKAARKAEDEAARRDEILKRCTPEKGSILAELRDKDPLWHKTIGRVIRPELLSRKDLSPHFISESGGEILGWQIDIDRIENPEWATTIEDQELQLKKCEDALDHALSDKKKCTSELDKSNKAFFERESGCNELTRKLGRLEQELQSAAEGVAQIKQNNRNASSARMEEAKSALARYTASKEEVEKRRSLAIAEAKTRAQLIISEGDGRSASEASRLRQENDAYSSSINDATSQHNTALLDLKDDLDARRSERGVDQEVISRAEKALNKAKDKCNKVGMYAGRIDEYDRWLKLDWERHEKLESDLSEATTKRDRAKTNLAKKTAEFEGQHQVLQSKITGLESDERKYNNDLAECQAMMGRLGAPIKPVAIGEQQHLEMLLADGQRLIDERDDLKKGLRHGVAKAEALILKGGNESKIAVAWEYLVQVEKDKLSSSSSEDIDDDLLILNKTLALDYLLSVYLTQLSGSAATIVENLGMEVTEYYLKMRSISGEIRSQSREISSAIGKKRYFEAIGEIEVSLKSRVGNEDFWPDLQDFYGAWNTWKEAGSDILCPDIQEALLKAIAILDRGNASRSLRDLFDLEISLSVNNRQVKCRTTDELEQASSTGLSYLILCSIYAGISRMLCRDANVKIHWPMDELGDLDAPNTTALFTMLDDYGIVMVGGFPSPSPTLLQHFKHHHGVQANGGGIVKLKLPEDELDRAIADAEHSDKQRIPA